VPPGQPGPPDPGTPDLGAPQPIQLAIAVSTATPTAGQPITLQVTNRAGPAPTAAHWTFGDGQEGDGTTTSHKWDDARPTPYLVSVTVTLADGRTAATSTPITVTAIPTVRLTVTNPGGGTVTGGGITCPGTCSVDLPPDTQVTLTATPDAAHTLGSWGGACSGTAATCDLTVHADSTVTYTFTTQPTVTLTVTAPTDGRITGPGINCPGTCTASIVVGTQVTLTVVPDPNVDIAGWSSPCLTAQPTCSLIMDADHTVSVRLQKRFNLTLVIDGPGEAQQIDGHIACKQVQSPCHFRINANETEPVFGVPFQQFDGCTGAEVFGNPPQGCQFVMDQDRTVIMQFHAA
jgi:hypothetical protein